MLGLVATNFPKRKLWSTEWVGRYNYPRPKTSAKHLTAAAAREKPDKKADCCYTVVVRPVPMTQSDWYPGDY